MINMKRIFCFCTLFVLVINMLVMPQASAKNNESNELLFNNSAALLSVLAIDNITENYEQASDVYVTRGAAVNAVMRSISKESGNMATGKRKATVTKTPYNDVFAGEWYAANVVYAHDMGIISSADTFRPDDNITFHEFVKIAVSALGYGVEAEQKGGYPDGYMVVAQSLGLLKGTSGVYRNVSKADFAITLFNLLQCPPVVRTSSGGILKIEVSDKILLETVFGATKGVGRIMQTSKSSVSSANYCGDNTVVIKPRNGGPEEIFYYEKINCDEFLGRTAQVYYQTTDNENKLLLITPYAKGDDLTTVYYDEFVGFSRNNKILKYKQTNSQHIWDNSSSTHEVKIDETCDIMVNGVFCDDESFAYDILEENKLNIDSIRLIDGNLDNKVDLVDIIAYYNIVPSFVNTTEKTMIDKYTKKKIELEPDNKEVEYAAFRSDTMRSINFTSIKVDNVVSVYEGNGKKTIYKFIVSSKKVDAAMKSKDGVGNKKQLVTSDDTLYTLSDNMVSYYDQIKLGTEYTFYIDAKGMIAGYKIKPTGAVFDEYGLREENASKAGTFFGIITGINIKDELEENLYIKIFTSDGTLQKYDVNEKCKVDGVGLDIDSYQTIKASHTGKLVQYELNADGLVRNITSPATERGDNTLAYANGFSDASKTLIFKHNANILYGSANTAIGSSTKIIYCPSDDYLGDPEDIYRLGKVADFANDKEYIVQAFYTGTDSVAADILLTYSASSATIEGTAEFFVVESISTVINKNEEVVQKIVGLRNGSAKEYTSAKETFVDVLGNVADIGAGDILQLSINAADECEFVKKLYDYDSPSSYTSATDYVSVARIIKGSVYDFDKTTICIVKNTFQIDPSMPFASLATELHDLKAARICVFEDIRGNATLKNGTSADFIAYTDDPSAYSNVVIASHYGNPGANIIIYK